MKSGEYAFPNFASPQPEAAPKTDTNQNHSNRNDAKRGGDAVHVPADVELRVPTRGFGLLALDEALVSLSKIDARKGRVVELRYFGGLSVEETAEFLGISPETVKRDWRMAKAWLLGELTGK